MVAPTVTFPLFPLSCGLGFTLIRFMGEEPEGKIKK
jgi:hypothetical protein